jgi:Winged helix DNA-binding domain
VTAAVRASVSARQLNRATLERQLLLRREAIPVLEAVKRVVALQAQEPASPYLALWNRVKRFDPADLDHAFAGHAIVKAQLFRITLQAVAKADYPAFHAAMTPTLRASRLTDMRFRRTGLMPADADALLPDVLAFAASPRTNAQAEAWLDDRLGVTPKPGVWWALRQCGPFWHHPTGGPWSFGSRPAYVAARPASNPPGPRAPVEWIVQRYLEGFGPATIQDIAQFTTIYRPPIKEAVTALGEALTHLAGPNGEELVDVPGRALPAEDAHAPPHLMAMWDSALLAYADRSRIVPPAYRKLVMRTNGDVLPTLLVDGQVAGVWRTTDEGIEATAFHRLAEGDWTGLDEEARALRRFLAERDATPYRRFAHWWAKLPSAEIRILGR